MSKYYNLLLLMISLLMIFTFVMTMDDPLNDYKCMEDCKRNYALDDRRRFQCIFNCPSKT